MPGSPLEGTQRVYRRSASGDGSNPVAQFFGIKRMRHATLVEQAGALPVLESLLESALRLSACGGMRCTDPVHWRLVFRSPWLGRRPPPHLFTRIALLAHRYRTERFNPPTVAQEVQRELRVADPPDASRRVQ